MTDTWWATVRKPKNAGSEQILVEIGGEPDHAALVALRAELGVPDDWQERRVVQGEPWGFSVAPGEPHPERFWSTEELTAAREGLEQAQGTRDKRAKVQALRTAIKTAGELVPERARKAMWDELTHLEATFQGPNIEQVRVKLLSDTPPSQATVRRKPPKVPTPTPGV